MKKRILAVLLMAALCLGMLAGCGGNGGEQSNGKNDATNNEQPQGAPSASGETNNAPAVDSTDDKEPPYQVGDSFVTSDKEQYEKYQAVKVDALKRASEITEENAESYDTVDNITWLLKDGILVFRGTGKLERSRAFPWWEISSDFGDSVNIIVVDEGITEIGEKITETGINKLDALIFPESLKSIDTNAFINSYSIKSVFLPDTEVAVANSAMIGNSLEYIDIGKSRWENISDVMRNCLVAVTMSSTHSDYVMKKDAIYTRDMETIVRIVDMAAEGFNFPDTVRVIGGGAFSGSSLKSVDIPDSVISIGFAAFYGSVRLTSVYISDSVETVGYNAFANCNINKIYIGKSIWENPNHIATQVHNLNGEITLHDEHTEYKMHEGILCDKNNTPLIKTAHP